MKHISKDKIVKLALTDATVRAHIDAQRYQPGITWEEMLHSLVCSLVEEKAAYFALSVDAKRRESPGVIVK